MDVTTRRDFIKHAGLWAAATTLTAPARALGLRSAPVAPVAIDRCDTYAATNLTTHLHGMFDRLGGLKSIAAGKTVAVKVNITGSLSGAFRGLAPGRTYQVHPAMVLAVATLLDRAGAKRIRFLEGSYTEMPFEQMLTSAGWDLAALKALHAKVEFEDTRHRGTIAPYTHVKVPWGGELFPEYVLNHSYVDCDSYVSLAKLKNHMEAGVTLSMKNNFGITPTALYAQGIDNEHSTDARQAVIHFGTTPPPTGVPRELHPDSPRSPGYRVPRHVVDVVGLRPIDLAIIDGIETVSGGEGPWCPDLTPIRANLLIAGRHPVCTDAVAVACMGYDPMSARATGPFPGDNHLQIAADRGLGVIDVAKIEQVGLKVSEAKHPFRWEPSRRYS